MNFLERFQMKALSSTQEVSQLMRATRDEGLRFGRPRCDIWVWDHNPNSTIYQRSSCEYPGVCL